MLPRHRSSSTEIELQRKCETLSIKLLRANAELRMKTIYASRLEVLVQERCAMIDALHGRIDQLRDQNKKLEIEPNTTPTWCGCCRNSIPRCWCRNRMPNHLWACVVWFPTIPVPF
jgi:hypothetical protein